jgi:hypothetical protein
MSFRIRISQGFFFEDTRYCLWMMIYDNLEAEFQMDWSRKGGIKLGLYLSVRCSTAGVQG